MPGRPLVELITSDRELTHRVQASAARAGIGFALASGDPPWGEPRGRRARIIDLTALADLPPSVMARDDRNDAYVLVLPSTEQNPCTRYHLYRRSTVDIMLEEMVREIRRELPKGDLLLGESEPIRLVREQIAQVAPYRDVSVLILGETGTGKELVAQTISEACDGCGPFVAINCAAIPEALFESELFGHDPGAFTGARGSRTGLLEAAASGTIFLDEVGEMPRPLQAKLLRVLESRTFRRVGSNADIPLQARVVSATNRPPGDPDHLRADLLYRLAGFTIELPPLRARTADIPILATAFLDDFASRHRQAHRRLTDGALQALSQHAWPGNVRELRRVVEQLAIVARGATIEQEDVERVVGRDGSWPPPPLSDPSPSSRDGFTSRAPLSAPNLPAMERDLIVRTFEESGRNLTRAATALGIPRSTLRDRLLRYGVPLRGEVRG